MRHHSLGASPGNCLCLYTVLSDLATHISRLLLDAMEKPVLVSTEEGTESVIHRLRCARGCTSG